MGHDIHEDAMYRVESSTATMVGEWYLHSRSAHRDARVIRHTGNCNGKRTTSSLPYPRRLPSGDTSGVHPLRPAL